MKPALLALLFLVPLAHAYPVYIGTTQKAAKGIYLSDYDPATGQLSTPELAIEAPEPSFLCLHPELPVIYASCGSVVQVFQKGEDHKLKLLQSVPVGGQGACHVETTPDGRGLATANYNDGTFSIFLLDAATGKISSDPIVTHFEGRGKDPRRQERPHAHATQFIGMLLLVPDLGTDRIMAYHFDPSTGFDATPWPTWKPPFIPVEPGDGPRHVAFHPDRWHFFAIHELSNHVQLWKFVMGEHPQALSRLSILPKDWEGTSTAAEILVHPNGKWVFASNRGHDSIAVIAFDPEAETMTLTSLVPCGVRGPRHFTVMPDGSRLLVAGENSNDIVVLAFDPDSGSLVNTGNKVPAPSPSCLLPVPEKAR